MNFQSLCDADSRWKLYTNKNKEESPVSNRTEEPDLLLVFEVNGKPVHENLTIREDEITTFKAFNLNNFEEFHRDKVKGVPVKSYYTGILP